MTSPCRLKEVRRQILTCSLAGDRAQSAARWVKRPEEIWKRSDRARSLTLSDEFGPSGLARGHELRFLQEVDKGLLPDHY